MKFIRKIKDFVLLHNNMDRQAERLIYKSIDIFHKGGSFNHWRAICLSNKIAEKYGCNIRPWITIGTGTYIAHARGIRIGGTVEIGNNCKFYPGCSLVAKLQGDEIRGKNNERRHPKIGDNCVIGAFSYLIGPITIGHNVIIGAGAVVRRDIPSYAIVMGNPAKIVGFTMTPEEAYKNELTNYSTKDVISLEELKYNYSQYYVSKKEEISQYKSVSL